jgi:DNA-binding NtrC family response regulator
VANLLFVAAASDNATAWRRDWMGVGHDVVALESIDRAINHLREGGIDLIILDTHDSLGSMSNLVASMNRLVDAPPLLLISDSPTAPEISARIGAAGFLPKPCDDNDVLREINRLVGPIRSTFTMEDEPTDLHRINALSALADDSAS